MDKDYGGGKGIVLYHGFLRDYFSNSLLYNPIEDMLIVQYKNDDTNRNYLVNISNEGNILWEIPTRINYFGHKIVLLNQDIFAIICTGFENLGELVFDKISFDGKYLDSVITNGMKGYIIENVDIIEDKIFLESYDRTSSSIFTNYIQKIDFNGNNYFDNGGILVLDSLGSIAKMFSTDSSIFVVTHHYAQAIDFEGNNLWDPPVLQYSTRYMGYHDFISDGNGGFIAFWLQYLDGVWGQQVSAKGKHGDVVTNIIGTKKDIIPDNYILYQNYPNPFNPSTTITYSLPVGGYIELKIFDILGREIAILENGEKAAGTYTITFNTKDFQSYIPSGVYFYTLFVKDQSSHLFTYQITKKMLLLK
ncbi:MAG: T9SS type A sorting domain-containing protein [Bacteroidetes bacterium]|nr:T9SS type A sorting domain-containing protein [Bacteroidota bacterium]